ncbi:LysR family transcriptional regulator [Sphingosinicella sp. BN140058]|nr:LysR family transcriptional regulator [Sphingosinicella sp. BN140058]
MNWDDLRLFLEIARAGTLTAAAERLGLSQPTAGRRLRALERDIGAALFQRSAGGFRLTDEGEAMFAHVERMEEDSIALERKLLGGARGLEGVLRLSASDWFATRILATPLAGFATANPRMTIELLTDSRLLDLGRREADLVFRFVPLGGADIVQRRFVRIAYGAYAAASYIDRCGDPAASADGAGHRLITLDAALDQAADLAWLRGRWPRARLSFRSNNREAQGAACVHGGGIAVLPRVIGDGLPLVHLSGEAPPGRDVWIGYHQDLRRLQRLRTLVDHLTATVPREI